VAAQPTEEGTFKVRLASHLFLRDDREDFACVGPGVAFPHPACGHLPGGEGLCSDALSTITSLRFQLGLGGSGGGPDLGLGLQASQVTLTNSAPRNKTAAA
jgi:hypothetical protein